jgi:hypothetical protein
MLQLETNKMAFEIINPETIKIQFSCKAKKEFHSRLYGRNISAIIEQYQIEGIINQQGYFINEIFLPKEILNNNTFLTLSIQGVRENIIIQIGSLIPQSILEDENSSIQNLNKTMQEEREILYRISQLQKKTDQTLEHSESIKTQADLHNIHNSFNIIQKDYFKIISSLERFSLEFVQKIQLEKINPYYENIKQLEEKITIKKIEINKSIKDKRQKKQKEQNEDSYNIINNMHTLEQEINSIISNHTNNLESINTQNQKIHSYFEKIKKIESKILTLSEKQKKDLLINNLKNLKMKLENIKNHNMKKEKKILNEINQKKKAQEKKYLLEAKQNEKNEQRREIKKKKIEEMKQRENEKQSNIIIGKIEIQYQRISNKNLKNQTIEELNAIKILYINLCEELYKAKAFLKEITHINFCTKQKQKIKNYLQKIEIEQTSLEIIKTDILNEIAEKKEKEEEKIRIQKEIDQKKYEIYIFKNKEEGMHNLLNKVSYNQTYNEVLDMKSHYIKDLINYLYKTEQVIKKNIQDLEIYKFISLPYSEQKIIKQKFEIIKNNCGNITTQYYEYLKQAESYENMEATLYYKIQEQSKKLEKYKINKDWHIIITLLTDGRSLYNDSYKHPVFNYIHQDSGIHYAEEEIKYIYSKSLFKKEYEKHITYMKALLCEADYELYEPLRSAKRKAEYILKPPLKFGKQMAQKLMKTITK